MEAEAGPAGRTLDVLPGGEGTATAGRGQLRGVAESFSLGG